MEKRSYVSLTLGIISIMMLFAGLYTSFFPGVNTVSELKESVSDISIPTPIPAYTTRQAIFSAQAGDTITFHVSPVTGFPPMPIWGYSVSMDVYFGSQVLYSNTAEDVDGTVNLPQTGTYSFQIANDNNFEVMFQSTDVPNSYLRLHHPYTEYSQVQNTSLQSLSLVLIMTSVVIGIASLLILAVHTKQPLSC